MRSLIGGVAATAAVRAWPFRVFSFPSQPMIWGGSAYLKDAEVIYAAIQERLAEGPAAMNLFGAGTGFSSVGGLRALALANGNTIKFNLHPLQRELIRGLE